MAVAPVSKKKSKAELLFRLFPTGKHFLFSLFFPQESIEQIALQAKQGGAIRSKDQNWEMQRRADE